MNTCQIHRDILGADYETLVRFLGRYATTCQLTSHGGPMMPSCRETMSRLSELGEVAAEVSEWHGTKLESGMTATLHSFPITPGSLHFLLEHVGSLFSWRWPDEPEDLCFLAADETPLLISIAHERYAQLTITADMYISEALKSVLEVSAQNEPNGFLVNVPEQSCATQDGGMVYVGIEGEGWPVVLTDMPTISFGLAPENAFRRSFSYWQNVVRIKGLESARFLYLGEHPPCEGFRCIGFDCGYYSNEIDNFSLVLNELHRQTMPSLVVHRKRLNAQGLFSTYEDATFFMRQVLSEPMLMDSYKGCLKDTSIIKVHGYVSEKKMSVARCCASTKEQG